MENLTKNAEKLDIEKGLDEKSIQEKAAKIRDYRRRLAKLHARMIRTPETPPSNRDFENLFICESIVNKPQ